MAMIKKVGVIGSGQMGNGIAHVAALAGFDVVLNDVSADRLKSGMATINGNLSRQVAKKAISEDDKSQGARPHHADRDARRAFRLRPRDRDRGREGRGQAQAVSRSLRGPEARGADRVQHLVDLDHAACCHHRPPRALHRHSLHESGAADGTGRADPRHRHRRFDLRVPPRSSSTSSASRSRSPRISRPSSSTAFCCR